MKTCRGIRKTSINRRGFVSNANSSAIYSSPWSDDVLLWQGRLTKLCAIKIPIDIAILQRVVEFGNGSRFASVVWRLIVLPVVVERCSRNYTCYHRNFGRTLGFNTMVSGHQTMFPILQFLVTEQRPRFLNAVSAKTTVSAQKLRRNAVSALQPNRP